MAHLDSASRTVADPELILSGYRPHANNFDEMINRDGRVREDIEGKIDPRTTPGAWGEC